MSRKKNIISLVPIKIPHKCILFGCKVQCYQEPNKETCEKCVEEFWEV
jgi:hypothetical protein